MAVLGVSGSPKVGGNTDRMIKAVLEKSGKETDFINLSTLRFDPCRGCCHLCASTNICGRKDKLHPYLKLVLESEALVLGTPYQLGMPTGFMYNFLTRLECFHHVKILIVDKPAILISVGCKQEEIQDKEGIPTFERMVTHSDQIKSLGHIYFNSQSPPCLACGEGRNCYNGGLWKYVLEQDENKLRDFEFTPDKFKKWEDYPQIVEEVNRHGKILAELSVR
ncbi:MAG: flavodoxin family protein [Planctomycetota bacterium]